MTSADPAELVRAVVDAARTWRSQGGYASAGVPLHEAVAALEAHLAELAEQPTAITWGRVCPGDRIRAKDGRWYEVTAVKAGVLNRAGTVQVTAQVGGKPMTVTKQCVSDVVVKRGPEGTAADLFDGIGITTEVLTGWTR